MSAVIATALTVAKGERFAMMPAGGGPEWNRGLAGTPLAIAATNAQFLRVQAGPGTGKTYAMMRRVMRFLEEGIAPDRILVCSFTRTAADDLARSLVALGAPGVERVQAGTLHSFCFSTLRSGPVLQATGRVPRPLTDFETRFLLEDLAGGAGGFRVAEQRLLAFGAAWARLQTEVPGWPADPVDRQFHNALLAWLQFHGGILIEELVPLTLRYLRDNPLCPERDAFDRVVVDEYQDLNRADQMLFDLLVGNGTLTVVGDEDQSIYAFRYAHPDGIREFHAAHVPTEDQDLTECRRCPQLVVRLAAALIANNASFSGRPLAPRAANPEGQVQIVQWPSSDAEAAGLALYVRQRIDAGEVTAGKVLVLSPRKAFGYAVRDALLAEGVVAHSFFTEQALDGNPKVLGNSRVQQAYTLLTLLVDPNDAVALRCWCGFGNPALAEPGWRRMREHLAANGGNLRDVLADLEAGRTQIAHTAHMVDRFRLLTAELAAAGPLTGDALVDRLFPDGEEWAEPLREIAEAQKPVGEDFTPASLYEVVRSGVTQPELPVEVDFVRVMSLHKSKGLTADFVIVTGCIEGAIPNLPKPTLPAAERDAKIEEQRRLFYVALTRATRTLVISSVTTIPRKVGHKMRIPVVGGNREDGRTVASRFVAEMGNDAPAAVNGQTLLV